jgi:hypothetical protein
VTAVLEDARTFMDFDRLTVVRAESRVVVPDAGAGAED